MGKSLIGTNIIGRIHETYNLIRKRFTGASKNDSIIKDDLGMPPDKLARLPGGILMVLLKPKVYIVPMLDDTGHPSRP